MPGCPLVDHVRATLHDTFRQAGLSLPVEELEGPYPSPTLLIDGIDVTGRTATPEASCRLDLPTPQQILDALALPAPDTVLSTGQALDRSPAYVGITLNPSGEMIDAPHSGSDVRVEPFPTTTNRGGLGRG